MLNNTLLLVLLRRDGFAPAMNEVFVAMIRSVAFALLAAFPALYYTQITHWVQKFSIPSLPDAVPLMLAAAFFGIVYLGFSLLCKAPELKEFFHSLISRKSRKKEC